jgi:hypothetical protein
MRDLQLRPVFFKCFGGGAGDLGVFDIQDLKMFESLEVLEPGVSDASVVQEQELEVGQPFDRLETVVADLGVVQEQGLSARVSSRKTCPPIFCSSETAFSTGELVSCPCEAPTQCQLSAVAKGASERS